MTDMSSLRELCQRMKALQEQKAALDEQSTALNTQLDELRLKLIPEMMDALELRNASFVGIGRVALSPDLYCSTRAGRKDEVMQWLRDQELGGMITETYNAGSLKALVRRLIVDGTEFPEFLNVLPFIRASITAI